MCLLRTADVSENHDVDEGTASSSYQESTDIDDDELPMITERMEFLNNDNFVMKDEKDSKGIIL
jgi:hypothetical protein